MSLAREASELRVDCHRGFRI